MLKLILIRHGKAAKSSLSGKDFDRELNKKGTAQINQVGFILERDAYHIDQVISSSAQRTTETAEILNFYIGYLKINFDKQLYLVDKNAILHHIIDKGKGDTILFVGHNFGISEFASSITGEDYSMSTGMLIEIAFDLEDWYQLKWGCGKVVRIIVPKVQAF